MPALLGALGVVIAQTLMWLVTHLVGRIMLLTGLSFVTYKGLEGFVDNIRTLVIDRLTDSGMGEFMITSLAILKFDVVVSILLSALALKFTINAASGITKMVMK